MVQAQQGCTFEDIATLVAEQLGVRPSRLTPETTLQGDLGAWGDDVDEIIEILAERFGTDVSSYLWYFHTREEGFSLLGRWIFSPPDKRVQQIPISLQLLLDSARAGRWLVEYPEHRLPEHRYDIWADRVLIALLLALVVGAAAR